MQVSNRPKIGVFVVAYNAEMTIDSVLGRITPETWERIDEVFIFDDKSQDDTTGRALQSRKLHGGPDKVRIYANQVNLGYGGNQKRGYRYAIENDFDIVVMLHGDGQYAPEELDRMLDPIAEGDADAVFGSRMMDKGAARSGGMPLYKYAGNKILTWFENWLLDKKLTEYHSGYRAYRVAALEKLPLQKNSNDFHFDNEIIVQLMAAGKNILEIPIPTYYGDEICRVNGIAYAFNVAMTAIRYRLHRMGLLYSGQFEVMEGAKYAYKDNRYSSHNRTLEMIDEVANGRSLCVLDLGCGAGLLARRIVDKGHKVTGADMYDNEEARAVCDKFFVVDVEKDFGVGEDEQFDLIILADIIEHVREPEALMLEVRKRLADGGKIIASTGNVANLYIRMSLLFGVFTYTERGILDRTHCRLFTKKTFLGLFADCGFDVENIAPTPIPFDVVMRGQPWLSDILCGLNQMAAVVWPSLFGFQFVITATPGSEATELLRQEEINAHYQEREAGEEEG